MLSFFTVITARRSGALSGAERSSSFTSAISPPQVVAAFLEISASEKPCAAFIAMNLPPILTKGRHISQRIGMEATARAVATSKLSRSVA